MLAVDISSGFIWAELYEQVNGWIQRINEYGINDQGRYSTNCVNRVFPREEFEIYTTTMRTWRALRALGAHVIWHTA